MSKAVKWQIPFVSTIDKTKYRIDIYAEGYSGNPIQLLGGPQPFVTEENKSDDFFTPVRSQTGNIQVCTAIPAGGTLSLDDILPANNIDHPIRLVSISGNTETIEWQGFLSCEAYSQSYTSIPQILTLPVISVLEACKSVEKTYTFISSTGGNSVSGLLIAIVSQIESSMSTQVSVVYSQASDDILNKYIFDSQFFSYKKNEVSGIVSYIRTNPSLYDILLSICKFMGWVLREQGTALYFERVGSDELGLTEVEMSSLEWRGDDHKRTVKQGAKSVSVEAKVTDFNTYFEMPICPTTGLTQKILYPTGSVTPAWYYDKCTQASVGVFTSADTTKCFLARFYGIMYDSYLPWEVVYEDLGFNNIIYLVGSAYSASSYPTLCAIKSVLKFSAVCGIQNTNEDAGHFHLRIKEENKASYIRCSLKFIGKYYSGVIGQLWTTNPATFKVSMTDGVGEVDIPLPKINNAYTFATSQIELYLTDDFDNGKTSALISDISITYEPPFRKYTNEAGSNRYTQSLSSANEEVDIELDLSSAFVNKNALSNIYGIKTYTYGQEEYDYFEPITSLIYNLAGGTTESRRPEVDLLNRLAAYYGAARQTLELKVKHPTAAALPLLKLNGISPDTKKYLPLAESRDWIADVATLTCFETPE